MFITWRKRKMVDGAVSLTAVLLENRWIDGQSRPRHIKNLGSIIEGHRKVKLKAAEFWKTVEERLGSLGLSDEEVARARRLLRFKVPIPTTEELEAEARAIEAHLHSCVHYNRIC